MDIENMRAQERKQQQRCLADRVETARATVARAKEELRACKAALKAAQSAEEKRTAAEACKAAEQAAKEAAKRVAEAVAQEKAFRETLTAVEQKVAAAADPLKALAAKYAKAYPDSRAFHITSDRQVFLERDENLARYHQKSLGGGEVRTINVR